MIYLIGGAARAGKTLLARRLLDARNVPCFCIDYFVSALDQGAPELGIEADAPNLVRSRLLWPRLRPMLRNIIEVEPDYTIDGDALWPEGAAEMVAEYGPEKVRACFLGYAEISPERKFSEIRRYGGGVNDWLLESPDDYVLALAREMIAFSAFVRDECRRLNLPYYDVSEDFPGMLEQAYRSLGRKE